MKKIYFLAIALTGLLANAQVWVDQPSNLPANFWVDEISLVDENVLWATASGGTGVYPKDMTRTTNGGSTWVSFNAEEIPSGALVSDIHGIDGNTAFVVTAPSSGGVTNNGIWKTTDGGTNWTKYAGGGVYAGSASFANHIYFWDANNGYSGGDPVAGKFEMYRTTDGGATWTAITTAPAPQNADEFTYVGLKEVVGDNIWLGTSTGRILRSNDRGVTWEAFSSPAIDFGGAVSEGSRGVYTFKDAMNGLLITVDGGSAFIYSTTDGGATWQDIVPSGVWYSGSIKHVPGTANTYVSTNSLTDNPIYGSSYSTDGGLTWIEIDTEDPRGQLAILNGTTMWSGYQSDGPGGVFGFKKFDGDIGDMAVVDENAKSNLQVYPNPSSSIVNFTAKKEIVQVNVIDMTGKVVSQTKGTQVNVSSLPAGVYVAQVKYANGGVENTKVVVK